MIMVIIVSRPESVLKQMGDEYFEIHGIYGNMSLPPERKKSRVAKMRGSNHIEISLVDHSLYYPVGFENCTGFEGNVSYRCSQKVSNLFKGD